MCEDTSKRAKKCRFMIFYLKFNNLGSDDGSVGTYHLNIKEDDLSHPLLCSNDKSLQNHHLSLNC